MTRLSATEREERAKLKRALAELEKPIREARKAERKARVKARPKRDQRVKHDRAKVIRERDFGYLSWLHEDLPCIACLVLGPPANPGPIEAAHQKINAASRGVQKRAGVRPDDVWTLPLCRHHHQIGPPCCDPAQAKFWALVGLSPEETADFCRALHSSFSSESDGRAVIADFASLAAGNRSDRACGSPYQTGGDGTQILVQFAEKAKG